jgi:hypothetical protein
MKKSNLVKQFTILLFFYSFTPVYSQEILSGKIISCKDKKPLAFANVVLTRGFPGATSDENGEFQLDLKTSNSNDSLIISYVGFKTIKEPITILFNKQVICLEESAVMLNEVVVSTKPLDHKKLFEKFRLIRGNLYAQDTETSMAEFNLFLKEIDGTSSAKYNYDLSGYAGAVKEFYERYHANIAEPKAIHRKNHLQDEEGYAHYPVVNITHQAAIAYCQWLTDEYNNQKKRKFRKVRFRLPTINEWQIAALGYSKFQSWNLNENTVLVEKPRDSLDMIHGRRKDFPVATTDIYYPWHGAYYYRKKPQNNHHCFLGNFKEPEKYIPCDLLRIAGDGYTMMGHVASYFPNDIGLYDVVGNVAEMIDENGKACGGSWNHLPNESTIHSVANYIRPNSWVGFRAFMEVIEK